MARPSRKKRKRNHRRLQVEAIARSPQPRGGWGQGTSVTRGDLLLVRQAIREGWPVSAEVKRLVADDVWRAFDADESLRLLIAIARTAVAMEGVNQRAELAAMRPENEATR